MIKKTTAGKDVTVQKTVKRSGKKSISPMERWKMVAEAAYYRAQKRGFIGGNPMDDWMEAEREIDGKYVLDYSRIMALLDSSEMMRQFSKVFGGVLPQPHLDFDSILEEQRKNIEALASTNRLIFDSAQGIVDRQMEMFRELMDQTVASINDASNSQNTKALAGQQIKLLQFGVEKSIASMRDLTESVVKTNSEAFDIANKRMMENMSEIKRLIQKLKG